MITRDSQYRQVLLPWFIIIISTSCEGGGGIRVTLMASACDSLADIVDSELGLFIDTESLTTPPNNRVMTSS